MDGIQLWNNLPDDVKDLDSFDSFCDEIKPLAKRNELYNGFTREANSTCAAKNAVQQLKWSFV